MEKFLLYQYIITSLSVFLLINFIVNIILFKNYSKLAARSLTNNKFYSFIHIFGFATALSIVLLLFLYVIYEASADKFHKNYNNIIALKLFMKQTICFE